MNDTSETIGKQSPNDRGMDYGAKRWMLVSARYISAVFRPNFYPTVAFLFLMNCTYLSVLPFLFRLYVIALIFGLTVVFPYITVLNTYRWFKGDILWRSGMRRRLMVGAIYALYYIISLVIVWDMSLPSYTLAVPVIALCLLVVCSVIRLKWRICAHSAAVGAFIGALVAYAPFFGINPVWWLCVLIAVSGLVSSSRMLLRRHTLLQVLAGTWVGICCGVIGKYIV